MAETIQWHYILHPLVSISYVKNRRYLGHFKERLYKQIGKAEMLIMDKTGGILKIILGF